MGHFFSRAIKRLTLGGGGGGSVANSSSGSSKSASRNQLPDNEQQEPHGQLSNSRDSNRPTVQAIPVGQSIDSAEYAAFENASASALLRTVNQDETTTRQRTSPPPTVSSGAQIAINLGHDGEHENKENAPSNELANLNDQDKQPEVEEAVIKIQALVRGHLTRKALKDAQQQAASVAPNALGQRQFDEKSLIMNPPNAIFLPGSPLSSILPNQHEVFNNNDSNVGSIQQQQQQQQQQQSNKHHTNPRVPPLESIAEDEIVDENKSSANLHQETHLVGAKSPLAISEEGQRRRLSSVAAARQLAAAAAAAGSNNSSNEAATTPSSPQWPPSSTANASIDIHCDTPASSVSIDILDHTGTINPMGFGLASVLHPQHSTTVSAEQPSRESELTGNIVIIANNNINNNNNNNEIMQRTSGNNDDDDDDDDDNNQLDILPDISGMPPPPPPPASRGVLAFENNNNSSSGTLVAGASASSLPATPPNINLATTINSHSIDSAEAAAAIRIQSAFRGYHTRKHSPYRRRRSPVNGPTAAAGAASLDSQTNGYSNCHDENININNNRARRNLLLRQRDPISTRIERVDNELDELDGDELDESVEGGRLMAENLANTLLADDDDDDDDHDDHDDHDGDKDNKNDKDDNGNQLTDNRVQLLAMGELESDDIERIDPSGFVSEHAIVLPQIGNIDSFDTFEQPPALVSSSSFEDDQQQLEQQQDGQNNDRLDVVSPDEAIGSGISTPALASDNSSEDGEHSDFGESAQLAETSGAQQQQSAGSGRTGGDANGANKNKKRNRNKRKGKK